MKDPRDVVLAPIVSEKSYALLERLDHESLAQQRRVTVPFLRRIMGLPSRP